MTREEAAKKAQKLVSKMSVEEKASQLRYNSPAIPRLSIPAYNWWNEGLHGVARAGVATVFPQAIGLAATFDPNLLNRIADAIAMEGRAKYNAFREEQDGDIYKGLTYWAPNINIFRDPRWGRGHETYGEDPYLTSRLGVAYVHGLQGEYDENHTMKAAACAKHFAVHSGPEELRHEFDAKVSPKDLYETYLPAFEALVKEGNVEAVMGAYNRTNGEPCCGSKTLLQDILRDTWKFQGHVVSDCWAVRDFHLHHEVTKTPEESVKMALDAGCDLNCGCTFTYILSALNKGLITEEQITKSCERLYTTRYLLGLMDGSEFDSIDYFQVNSKEHLDLSLESARESMVLLKNDGILPLDSKRLKTIAVVGPNANSRIALCGNYHGTASRYVTALEGIQDFVGEEVRVLYSEGCDLSKAKVEPLAFDGDRISEAKIVAKRSDVTIVVVGLDETLEGEEADDGNAYASGDKDSLDLPKSQQELVEAIAETGVPFVVVVMAGSALDLSYMDATSNAILQAWYPGALGGTAIADTLFGKCSPQGKLPLTFYQSLDGLPDFTDYSMKGRTYRYLSKKPLYPFGYGLTYGDVVLDRVENIGFDQNKSLCIKVDLSNQGKVETGDVVQAYIRNSDSKYAIKNPCLCAFQAIRLAPGEQKQVNLAITEDSFMVVNEEGERILDGNNYVVYVDTKQPDERSQELIKSKPWVLNVYRD
jgi:beta-glucosidase